MPQHSRYQQNIIRNYYENRDAISLQRAQELVTELYLAETDRSRDGLWRRVEKAMKALDVPGDHMQDIVSRRDIEVLARNVRAWLDQATKPSNRRGPKA